MALIYCSKKFLNSDNHCEPSVIVSYIDEYDNVSCVITDCSRKIELHGDLTEENTTQKLDILIDELIDLRSEVNKAREVKKVLEKIYTTKELAQKALNELIKEVGYYPSKKQIVPRKFKDGYKLVVTKKLFGLIKKRT